jgi:uncharacterized protein DUF3631
METAMASPTLRPRLLRTVPALRTALSRTPVSHLRGLTTLREGHRAVDQFTPTLLVDEVDATGMSGQLRRILNSGYDRGGKVVITETIDGLRVPVSLSTFCPKAFAGIGRPLPDTLSDRSIQIRLQRRGPNDYIERFRPRDAARETEEARQMLSPRLLELVAMMRRRRGGTPSETPSALWAENNTERLAEARPHPIESINDRAQDHWEPLLAIGDLSGFGTEVRAAARALSSTAGARPCGAAP